MAIRRDARAVVAHFDDERTSALERHPALTHAQRDGAVALVAVARVVHHVNPDVLELLRVGPKPNVSRRLQIELAALLIQLGAKQVLDLAQRQLRLDRDELGLQGPGQVQKVFHHLVQLIGFLADGHRHTIFGAAFAQTLLESPQLGGDGGQRLFQFVGLPDGKSLEVRQLPLAIAGQSALHSTGAGLNALSDAGVSSCVLKGLDTVQLSLALSVEGVP